MNELPIDLAALAAQTEAFTEQAKTEKKPPINLTALKAKSEELSLSILSGASREARAYDWKSFSGWCSEAGLVALPASAETVGLYITYCLQCGRAVGTMARRACTISSVHKDRGYPSPVGPAVHKILSGARRDPNRPKSRGAKTALSVANLRDISLKLGTTHEDLRDRAIVLFGFHSAMRRSEIAALDVSDLNFEPAGVSVHIGRSKRDQVGAGCTLDIFAGQNEATCAVRALTAWLAVRGDWDGPLFLAKNTRGGFVKRRLGADGIYALIKRCVKLVGLDPAKYGAHSLRSGMVTAALDAGVSDLQVMARSRHSKVSTLKLYHQHAAFTFNPLGKCPGL
jgi:integrase